MGICSILYGISVLSSVMMVIASEVEPMKDWYPKDADVRKKLCDEEHRNHDNRSDLSIDESLREYVLCVAKELNVYSKETGLNLARLTQLTFANGHIDFQKSASIIESCNEQYRDETAEEIMIYKILTCTMDEYHKIVLNQTRTNTEL